MKHKVNFVVAITPVISLVITNLCLTYNIGTNC